IGVQLFQFVRRTDEVDLIVLDSVSVKLLQAEHLLPCTVSVDDKHNSPLVLDEELGHLQRAVVTSSADQRDPGRLHGFPSDQPEQMRKGLFLGLTLNGEKAPLMQQYTRPQAHSGRE